MSPLIAGDFSASKSLQYLQRLTMAGCVLLLVGLLVTIGLYSQVVIQKSQLQKAIRDTQRLNEANNAYQIKVNQARSFNQIARHSAQGAPHLTESTPPLTLTATQPLLPAFLESVTEPSQAVSPLLSIEGY